MEASVESYEIGSSKFYVTETPLPLAQAVNSPIPPPRRHNPFNRPDNSPHQRSQSVRSNSGKSNLFLFVFFNDLFSLL